MKQQTNSKILIVNTLSEDNSFANVLLTQLKTRYVYILVAHNPSELIELLTFWQPHITIVILNRESKINLQFIKSTKVNTKLGLIYADTVADEKNMTYLHDNASTADFSINAEGLLSTFEGLLPQESDLGLYMPNQNKLLVKAIGLVA